MNGSQEEGEITRCKDKECGKSNREITQIWKRLYSVVNNFCNKKILLGLEIYLEVPRPPPSLSKKKKKFVKREQMRTGV